MPVHSVMPPLTVRVALLLVGAIAGSAALAVPRLARALRSTDSVGKRGAAR